MKRLSIITIAIAMCLVLVVTAGCYADVPAGSSGTASLIITTDTDELTTYTVSLEKLEDATAVSLLEYLVDTQELHLVIEDGSWGAYITEIGTLVATADTWISIYTSVESDKDTSSYCTTVDIDGITVYTSGLGVTSMSLSDGCVIYITLGSY